MFLLIPSGDVLQPLLRVVTLESIRSFAMVAGLPHRVEGFMIFIGTHRYIVLDECSGLAYVTLTTFLGYCFGSLLYRSFGKVVFVAAGAATLGVLTNVIRVNAIVLVDWIRDSQMDLSAHGAIQWVALLVTLAVLLIVVKQLDGDVPQSTLHAARAARPSWPRKMAPVVTALAGLSIVVSARALPGDDSGAAGGLVALAFPQALSRWHKSGHAESDGRWIDDAENHTRSAQAIYRRGDHDIEARVTQATRASAKLPELEPGDTTQWHETQVTHERACSGSRCVTFRHASWIRDRSRETRHTYSVLGVANFTTDSRFALRAAHGWHRLRGDGERPHLIGFVTPGPALEPEELADARQEIQSVLEHSSSPQH